MKLSDPNKTCELEDRVNTLDDRVSSVEFRLANVETAVSDLRKESQLGFKEVTSAVNSLGHDFGDRMNLLDKRIIEDKEKWGTVLRESVKWTVRVLLVVASAAAGVNLAAHIFK